MAFMTSAARSSEAAASGGSPERRGAQRAITVYRVVRVEKDGREGLARCRNISNSGARLQLVMDLQLNDTIDIGFSSSVQISARVVWLKGEDCGVAFTQEIDSAAVLARPERNSPSQASRSPRLQVSLSAKVRSHGQMMNSHISNISQHGMKLSHDGSFREGLQVTVFLPGGREKIGVVRWSCEGLAVSTFSTRSASKN